MSYRSSSQRSSPASSAGTPQKRGPPGSEVAVGTVNRGKRKPKGVLPGGRNSQTGTPTPSDASDSRSPSRQAEPTTHSRTASRVSNDDPGDMPGDSFIIESRARARTAVYEDTPEPTSAPVTEAAAVDEGAASTKSDNTTTSSRKLSEAGVPTKPLRTPASPTQYAFHFLPYAAEQEVQQQIVRKLIPTRMEIDYRKRIIVNVCQHIEWILRNNLNVRCDLKCYIFGSVHLRTCLPDGDNDVTIVFEDGDTSSPSVQSTHADYLNRVKDLLPPTIAVESLVWAEVRVLKLVAQNYSLDVTVDQMGGTSTVCFLHEVDMFIGNHHLFKKALLLTKAWCFYEARILGAQGGGVGTYALTVMLITVMNNLLKARVALPSPFGVFLYFLQYYSEFDFERYAVSIQGPIPLDGIRESNATGETPVGSPSMSDTAGSDPSTAPTGPRGQGRALTEEFVARCQKKYGMTGSDPASMPTSTTPPTMAEGSARSTPIPGDWPPSPTVQFPVRHMNVMDPLRPHSNLCRGISLSNSWRIRAAFQMGHSMFLARMNAITEGNAAGVVDDYFRNTFRAVEHIQPDPESAFNGEYQCATCLQGASPFCCDFDTMQNPAIVFSANNRRHSNQHVPPPGVRPPESHPVHAAMPTWMSGPTPTYQQFHHHQHQQPQQPTQQQPPRLMHQAQPFQPPAFAQATQPLKRMLPSAGGAAHVSVGPSATTGPNRTSPQQQQQPPQPQLQVRHTRTGSDNGSSNSYGSGGTGGGFATHTNTAPQDLEPLNNGNKKRSNKRRSKGDRDSIGSADSDSGKGPFTGHANSYVDPNKNGRNKKRNSTSSNDRGRFEGENQPNVAQSLAHHGDIHGNWKQRQSDGGKPQPPATHHYPNPATYQHPMYSKHYPTLNETDQDDPMMLPPSTHVVPDGDTSQLARSQQSPTENNSPTSLNGSASAKYMPPHKRGASRPTTQEQKPHVHAGSSSAPPSGHHHHTSPHQHPQHQQPMMPYMDNHNGFQGQGHYQYTHPMGVPFPLPSHPQFGHHHPHSPTSHGVPQATPMGAMSPHAGYGGPTVNVVPGRRRGSRPVSTQSVAPPEDDFWDNTRK